MGMLDGKVAIITGATSGIGRRTAELFVAEGASVVFTGRRRAEGETLAADLGSKGRFIAADATLEDDWTRVIAETLAAHGRIDALFNNAGGPAPTGSIASIPVDGFDRAMALLVRSVMLGMKHVAPVMMRQRSGSIVNNGSIAAHLAGYSSSMVYSAAKAAVNQLSRCAAMELGEHGVRVNSVSPGAIATGIVAKALGMDAGRADHEAAERMKQLSAKAQPIPRAGLPDDIAQCVVWLASDRSTFVNGIDIVVDGGMIGGRMYTPHQEGLKALKASFGI
jgi:NAD(P)-dependent dehydrogenase (short-subunit alcohol dehydrogenase family)